jgi:DmsE family decaheme c-type cytochrome
MMPSHHPIKEGRMTCTDCHDPHGRDDQFALSGEPRDACFSCHAEKQGPFIFEHAPVNEDCGICHDPHGTVADNLLVQTEPTLCLSCHPAHFHTQLAGYTGTFDGGWLHPERGGESAVDGFKSAMMTKCTQCHNVIHGSDLEAQSITAPGALTR